MAKQTTMTRILSAMSGGHNTIRSLSEHLGIDRTIVMYAIKVMEHDGTIKVVGKQPAAGGKGRSSHVYGIPTE
jgi:predicted ArsR family transcriptional regulator